MIPSRPLAGGPLANPWFAQGLPGTASYIRKAHRLFLSLIGGIVGYTYRIISKIRVPYTIFDRLGGTLITAL